MYSAMDIARYTVNKCIKDDCPITNLYLQNILYSIQAEYVQQGSRAFYDRIQAWRFGPCVPIVFYHYCGHGANPILYSDQEPDIILEKDREIIDPIIERLRLLDPWDDVFEEIRKKDGPWRSAIEKKEKTNIVL